MTIYKRNPGGFQRRSPAMPPPPGRRPNRLTKPINSIIKHNSSKDDIDRIVERIERLQPSDTNEVFDDIDSYFKAELHDKLYDHHREVEEFSSKIDALKRKRKRPNTLQQMIFAIIIVSLVILGIFLSKTNSNKTLHPSIEKQITEKVDIDNRTLKQL